MSAESSLTAVAVVRALLSTWTGLSGSGRTARGNTGLVKAVQPGGRM